MIVLYSSFEKVSRQFIESVDISTNQLIDWATDEAAKEIYLNAGMPHPSAFPTVVKEGTQLFVRCPESMEHAIELIDAMEEPDELKVLKHTLKLGYPVEGKDFHLSLDKPQRDSFAQMLVLLSEGLAADLIQSADLIVIKDINGALQELPAAELKLHLVKYGLYYKAKWDQIAILEA